MNIVYQNTRVLSKYMGYFDDYGMDNRNMLVKEVFYFAPNPCSFLVYYFCFYTFQVCLRRFLNKVSIACGVRTPFTLINSPSTQWISIGRPKVLKIIFSSNWGNFPQVMFVQVSTTFGQKRTESKLSSSDSTRHCGKD